MLRKSIIILLLLIVASLGVTKDNNEEIIENVGISETVKNPYIGYLVIDKIKMKLGFYDLDNSRNNVDYNIEVLKQSKEGRLIIAGHSGTGKVSFFNDLIFLKKGDEIKIIYQDKEYKYQVTDIYKEIKDGDINIKQNPQEKILILTTCDQIERGKQLVIKAILIS